MNITISKRLMLSASMVEQNAAVADVGCDHGYLGVWLLLQGIASHVFACDLRQMPLAAARRNADKYGVSDRMTLICADGLSGLDPQRVDTIVCAGMGGDLIRIILESTPWIYSSRYALILQPQSGAHDLRKWLFDSGFAIEREQSVTDGRLYFAMRARYTGAPTPYTPGTLFVTPQMLQTDCRAYLQQTKQSIERVLDGLSRAKDSAEKRRFYEQAYAEVMELMKQYDLRI